MDRKGFDRVRKALGTEVGIFPTKMDIPLKGHVEIVFIQPDPDGGKDKTEELLQQSGLTGDEKSPSLKYMQLSTLPNARGILVYRDTAIPKTKKSK